MFAIQAIRREVAKFGGADGVCRSEATNLANDALWLKNAFGMSEMGALELTSKLRRFRNQERAANVAIAMHQASGQSNATADESIQAMLQNYDTENCDR